MYDVIVIGAGLTGCAVARELTRYALTVAVLDKGADVAESGLSSAHSGIVGAAGYDVAVGSYKAELMRRGNELFAGVCEELKVPFKHNGAMLLCFDPAGLFELQRLTLCGVKNGVTGLRILDTRALHRMEPSISEQVVYALYAPMTGITDPYQLAANYAENASQNGAEFFFDTCVKAILRHIKGYWVIKTQLGTLAARTVVNAAGLYAGELNNMVSSKKYNIIPKRTEYITLDKSCVYTGPTVMIPTKQGVVTTAPTTAGNVILGCTGEEVHDKESIENTAEGLQNLLYWAEKIWPNMDLHALLTSFASNSVQNVPDGLFMGETPEITGLFNAGGGSDDLLCVPAIAEHIAQKVGQRLDASQNKDFDPNLPRMMRFRECNIGDQESLIRQDSTWGNIVCRCELITEYEIRAAIRRSVGARSIDGVKRRCGAGGGHCQGECRVRVAKLLSEELGVPIESIKKSADASFAAPWRRHD